MGQRTCALEGVVNAVAPIPSFWAGRRVLVTGHSGFKGGWLVHWLHLLGAEVFGLSLPASTEPSLFEVSAVARHCADHWIGDIRDRDTVDNAVDQARPSIVFHLAAQALVRAGYSDPVGTFSTNTIGTVQVLDACRRSDDVGAVVIVTTDKCYENREWQWGYRESDRLGGHDPYSASKSCAELATAAYRAAYFSHRTVGAATARAGNVIGGGDWSADRLIPDLLRSFTANRPAWIRNPEAVRPWQHVLDSLHGYLMLAQRLIADPLPTSRAWNFGPAAHEACKVRELAARFAELWSRDARVEVNPDQGPHEAGLLALDSAEARAKLGWHSRMTLDAALQMTVDWYRACEDRQDMVDFTRRQIELFMRADHGPR